MVYTKETFCGPEKVVEYVGRYAHKVAISEGRILESDGDSVSFQWKDYRADGEKKVATLRGGDFVRAFAQHVLPAGFRRIRYYGFWNPRGLARVRESIRANARAIASAIHALMAAAAEMERRHQEYGVKCPSCGELAFEAEAPQLGSLVELIDTS